MMPEILHAIENAEQHADELEMLRILETKPVAEMTDEELTLWLTLKRK